jgi:asparagine synthase (glutamine-hydrolysing)
MLPKVIDMFGEPFADPSAASNYHVSRLAKKDVTVALSGDGGDEIFAGYPWYVSLIKNGYFNNRKKYSKYASLLYNIWPKRLRGNSKLDLLRQPDDISIYLLMKNRFPNHFRNILFHKDFLHFLSNCNDDVNNMDIESEYSQDEILFLMQGVDIESYLPDNINVKVDRMSMYNSLEVRSPILDHKVVEFAYNLPSKMKINNSQNQKFILKEVFKSSLPKEIVERSKQGFGVPSKSSSKSDLNRLYNFSKEVLLDETSIKRKIFNQDEIEKLLFNHKNRLTEPTLSYNQIWSLVCLELWFQSTSVDLQL